VLERVRALARNLWWTWNHDAQRLFAALDPVLWEATNHNPLATIALAERRQLDAVLNDGSFQQLLAQCEYALRAYVRARTWFQRSVAARARRLRVAYFCAEYGLHECLPQYAGGLGVLAGDHLKSASDLGVPLVAVGLFYRSGYYQQSFDQAGATRAVYPEYDVEHLPLEDTRKRVRVPLGARDVAARIWRVQVGRVPLYLLDTDVRENRPADRAITRVLYGGDSETRIQQEIVLGMGGARALEVLGIRASVYHLNEGHAAFCALERLRQFRKRGMSQAKAVAAVRASTVFTTHTPVPAGHDRFPPALVRRYLKRPLAALGDAWLGLGRERPGDRKEPFCMTVLALRLSGKRNGVSRLHGEVSREMWKSLLAEEGSTIGHVTNGVHSQTWLAPELEPLYRRYLKPRWVGAGPHDDVWRRAGQIPPAELWAMRGLLRRKLVHFLRDRLRDQVRRRCGSSAELAAAFEALDENALTIGFARRFATYKRAPLVFRDAKRLAAILNHPQRPVQLVFAGKAHPRDAAGQEFAQRIYKAAQRSEFRGRVVLVENYDMQVGRMLTAGCDVWLNNPLRPQEASGTSGMKPPLHGGLNCSILDGWWPEAYRRGNGWAIDGDDGQAAASAESPHAVSEERTRAAQDRHDVAAIYRLIETEIAPLFYDRGRDGVPRGWVRRMVASMQSVCAQFSSHRMVGEYVEGYYLK